MQFGEAIGMAQSMQFDERIQDLRYQNQQMERAKAHAAASAKMFADEFSQGPVGSQFDDPIIKDYTRKKMIEAANVMRNNPNYKYDPYALAQLKAIQNDIKGNPHVLRAVAFVDAKKKLQDDLAEAQKNPAAYDQEAYQDLIQQVQNYDQYGHQMGKEAAAKEGPQPFIYKKPENFTDLNKMGLEIGGKFKGNALQRVDINNGRDGAWQLVPKQEYLDAAAQQMYLGNKRQFDIQYARKGVNPIEAAKQLISPGIETKFDIGDKNTLKEDLYKIRYAHDLKKADEAKATGGSPYRISILNPGVTAPATEDLAKTFGSDITHYYKDATGKLVPNQGDVFHYTNHLQDKGYREDGKYQKTGIKQATGYIYKPLDWGKEQGFVYDKWFDGRDIIVKPEHSGEVEIVDSPVDDKGNSHKLLKVKAIAEFNANDPSFEAKYNKLFLTNKQREGVNVEESLMDQTVYEDRNGKLWLKDANGNAIPYK